jgi:hypothetical protein
LEAEVEAVFDTESLHGIRFANILYTSIVLSYLTRLFNPSCDFVYMGAEIFALHHGDLQP